MNFIRKYGIYLLMFFFLISFFSDCESSLYLQSEESKTILDEINCDSTIVSVYWAIPNQTDNTPTITASGYKIQDIDNPPRICAVPRNLIGTKYNFGDSIFINTTDQYLKGWWRIEDVMNNRYSYCNRVDLLVKPNYINLLKIRSI